MQSEEPPDILSSLNNSSNQHLVPTSSTSDMAASDNKTDDFQNQSEASTNEESRLYQNDSVSLAAGGLSAASLPPQSTYSFANQYSSRPEDLLVSTAIDARTLSALIVQQKILRESLSAKSRLLSMLPPEGFFANFGILTGDAAPIFHLDKRIKLDATTRTTKPSPVDNSRTVVQHDEVEREHETLEQSAYNWDDEWDLNNGSIETGSPLTSEHAANNDEHSCASIGSFSLMETDET